MAGCGRSENKIFPIASGRFYQMTVTSYNLDEAGLNWILRSTVAYLVKMALLTICGYYSN